MLTGCSLVPKCAWLVLLFLFSSHPLLFAQELPPSSQETSGDDSVPAPEDEDAGQSRPVIKRFGAEPLTVEEQEEAKRLSAIAARMGTDPTAIIGRVQTLFRHDVLAGGSRVSNNLVGRIDVPYHKDFILRADLPYVWSHPNQFGTSNQGTSNQNGLSHLLVRTGGRVYSVPGDAIFAGVDFTFRQRMTDWGVVNTRWDRVSQRPTYFLRGNPSSSCCFSTNSRSAVILLAMTSPPPVFKPGTTPLDGPLLDPARGRHASQLGAEGKNQHDVGI